MTTTTPNLFLVLYDATGDQSATFATWRAAIDGSATTSNFYRIDTAYGTQASQITSLQSTRGAIPVASIFQSANFYSVTGITAITSYSTGMTIILSVDITSNGTVTLNINSLGIKSVMKVDSTGAAINLTGSDLVKGRQYLFEYDGTRWLWVSANSADQIQIVGTSGNVVTVGSTNNLDGTLTQSLLLSQTTHSATAKTTLADADEVGIVDSAASNVLKRITWANIATAIGVKLGAVYAALTGKTTPVGADILSIADSASSNASKGLTITNLFATLGAFIVGYTAKTTPIGADGLLIADSASSNANKYVLLSNLYKAIGSGTFDSTTFLRGDGSYTYAVQGDGWIPAGETWTYASADSPTFTFTISGDKTTKYSAGMKVKLNQTTDKFFFITKVAYGAPNTTITIYGGTTYTLANSAISSPYFSTVKAPYGFPIEPSSWTLTLTSVSDRAQPSPVAGTWYNQGSELLDIHIGSWNVYYSQTVGARIATTSVTLSSTLSTGASTESDTSFTAGAQVWANANSVSGEGSVCLSKTGLLTLTSKTTYYLNSKTDTASVNSLRREGATLSPTLIRATIAYL